MHLFHIIGARILVVTTTVVSLCLVVYARGRAIEWSLDDLRPYAEREATLELGRPVRIGHIGGNPFTCIVVTDISVSHIPQDNRSGDMARVARAEVRLSLWQALKGRVSFLRCVRSVDLERPSLYVKREADGRWQFEKTLRKHKKPKKHNIADRFAGVVRVRDGDVEYVDELLPPNMAGETVHVVTRNVDATLDFAEIGRVSIAGAMSVEKAAERIACHGDVLLDSSSADLMLEAQNIALVELMKWVAKPDDPSFRMLGGELRRMRAALTWGLTRPLQFFARGDVQDGSFQIPDVGAQPFNASGDLYATANHVGSSGVVVDYGNTHAVVAGTVFGLGRREAPRLELQVASDHVDYGQALQEYPILAGIFEDVQTSGSGSAEVSIVGSPGDLVVDGSLLMPAVFARTSSGWEASCAQLQMVGQVRDQREGASMDLSLTAAPMDVVIRDALAAVVHKDPAGPGTEPSSHVDAPPNDRSSREQGPVPVSPAAGPLTDPNVYASGEVFARLTGPIAGPAITAEIKTGSVTAFGTTLDRVHGRLELAETPDPDPPDYGDKSADAAPVFVGDPVAREAWERLTASAKDPGAPTPAPVANGEATGEPRPCWVVRSQDLEGESCGGRARVDVVAEVNGKQSEWAVDAELHSVDLARACEALGLTRYGLSGRADGQATMRISPEYEHPQVVADAIATDVVANGYRIGELSGAGELLPDGWVRVERLNTYSPYGEGTIWGDMGLFREGREVDLAFETQPVRLDRMEGLPESLTLTGLGIATGTVTGTLDAMRVEGDAQALGGRVAYAPVADEEGQTARTFASDFDSAQAHFRYEDSFLTLTQPALRAGAARIVADEPSVITESGNGAPLESAPGPVSYIAWSPGGVTYDLHLTMDNLTASQALAIVGQQETDQFRGRLFAQADVWGQDRDLQADVGVSLYDGEVAHRGLDGAEARFTIDQDQITLAEDARAWSGPAVLAVGGSILDIRTAPTLYLHWTAYGIPAGWLSEDLRRLRGLSGVLSSSGKLDGPLASPVVSGNLACERMELGNAVFTGITLSGSYFVDGDGVRVLQLSNEDGPMRANFGGGIVEAEVDYLVDTRELSVSAAVYGVRTDPLADLARTYLLIEELRPTESPESEAVAAPSAGGGAGDSPDALEQRARRRDTQRSVAKAFGALGGEVSARLEASCRAWFGRDARLHVDQLDLTAHEVELADATYDDKPVPPIAGSLHYAAREEALGAGQLDLDEVSMADETGAVSGSATINFAGEGRIAGHVAADRVQLGRLVDLFTDRPILSEGVAEGHLVFHGRPQAPSIEGTLTAHDVALDIDYARTDLPRSDHRELRFPLMEATSISVNQSAIRLEKLAFTGTDPGSGGSREVTVKNVLVPFRWSPFGIASDRPCQATLDAPEQDLSLLAFLPWVSPEDAGGTMAAAFSLSGTPASPVLTGGLTIKNGFYVLRPRDAYSRALLRNYGTPSLPIDNINATISFGRRETDQRNVLNIAPMNASVLGGTVSVTGTADIESLVSRLARGDYTFRLEADGLTHNLFSADPVDTSGLAKLSDVDVRLTDRGHKPTLLVEKSRLTLGPGQLSLTGSVALGRRPGAGVDVSQVGYNEWDLSAAIDNLPLDLGDIERLVRVTQALQANRDVAVVRVADYGVARMDGVLKAVGPGDGVTPTRITATDLRLSNAKVNLASGGSSGGEEKQEEDLRAGPDRRRTETGSEFGRMKLPLPPDFNADLNINLAQNVEVPDYKTNLKGSASLIKEGSELHFRGGVTGGAPGGELKVGSVKFNLRDLELTFDWSSIPASVGKMGPFTAHLKADADTSVISQGTRTKITVHVDGPLLGEVNLSPEESLAMMGGRPGGAAGEMKTGQLSWSISSDPPLTQRQILQLIGQDAGLPLTDNPADQFDFSKVASTDLLTVLTQTFLGSLIGTLADLAGVSGITLQYNARTGAVTLGVDRAITERLYLEGYYLGDPDAPRHVEGRITYDISERLQMRLRADERLSPQVELRYHTPF